MRVVFFDKMRETCHTVEDVISIESCTVRINGRCTSVWHIHKLNGRFESFKQKDFIICRVEVSKPTP